LGLLKDPECAGHQQYRSQEAKDGKSLSLCGLQDDFCCSDELDVSVMKLTLVA
jgi:hypothetical protein